MLRCLSDLLGLMGIFDSLKNVREKHWSWLTLIMNVFLIFIAIGALIWLGQWLWDKVSLIITGLGWIWNHSKILFAFAAFLLALLIYILGKYQLTQIWMGNAEEKSTMRMPEGDILKYVDGIMLNRYQKDGKTYVDGVMIAGGATPVREVPEEKILKTDKTVTEVLGSYFIPVISWFLRGMKQ